MKRTQRITAIALLLVVSVCGRAADFGSGKLQICLSGNTFFGSDDIYKELYGNSAFMPELGVYYAVRESIFLWTDLGFLSQQGTIDELGEKISISQLHWGLGLGFRLLNKDPFRLAVVTGLAVLRFREEAMKEKNSGSALGWKIGLQADFAIARKWFARLAAAFNKAKKHEDDLTMEFGGFQLGAGIGYSF